MKKIILTALLFLIFGAINKANSQDITLPRDVAETALKSLELVPVYETKIKALENLVTELKASQKTPCSIAIDTVKNTLIQIEYLDTSKLSQEDAKEVRKMRKKTYSFLKKNSSNLLQSQCGYKNENKLEILLKQLIPLSYLFLKV